MQGALIVIIVDIRLQILRGPPASLRSQTVRPNIEALTTGAPQCSGQG